MDLPDPLRQDPLGRRMRPRCGRPIRHGIYWGPQSCGQPEGHRGRCLSVEAYKRYLLRQREVNARMYAARGDAINEARRARYAQRIGEAAA
jgi:hypothetical protein